MLIRSIVTILIVVSPLVIVNGQPPDAQASERSGITQKRRELPLANGIDLQFLIKELARDMDLNVLFDVESFRGPRKAYIELKNVTTAEALDYLLLQEGLYFEEAGPKTILVASRFRGTSIPQIGVGITPMTEQLAQYFGVAGGVLINYVRAGSQAMKVGLTAGDVIVEIDGVQVTGSLGIARAINDKVEGAVILTIVRNGKQMTVSIAIQKGVESVLREPAKPLK